MRERAWQTSAPVCHIYPQPPKVGRRPIIASNYESEKRGKQRFRELNPEHVHFGFEPWPFFTSPSSLQVSTGSALPLESASAGPPGVTGGSGLAQQVFGPWKASFCESW